jgi:putative phosphoesterase
MRIAVLSDIHGNLRALEAVLADIKARGADLTVNLGDILSGPLEPAETADLLMTLQLPTIRGNHERQLLTQAPEEMGASDAYTIAQLTSKHLGWLRELPVELEIEDVWLCHGTPTSDLEYFLQTVEPSGLREATDEEVAARADNCGSALILCGHTHMPRTRPLRDGRIVMNPGSVGLPAYEDDRPYRHVVRTGSPHARYAIVERNAAGEWSASLLEVEYDHEGAARTAAARGRADWAIALRLGNL